MFYILYYLSILHWKLLKVYTFKLTRTMLHRGVRGLPHRLCGGLASRSQARWRQGDLHHHQPLGHLYRESHRPPGRWHLQDQLHTLWGGWVPWRQTVYTECWWSVESPWCRYRCKQKVSLSGGWEAENFLTKNKIIEIRLDSLKQEYFDLFRVVFGRKSN